MSEQDDQDDLDLNEVIPFPPLSTEIVVIIQQDKYDAMRQELDELRRQVADLEKDKSQLQAIAWELEAHLQDAQERVAALQGEWRPVEYVRSLYFPYHLYVRRNGFDLCDDDGSALFEFRYSEGDYAICRRVSREGTDRE